MKSPPIVLSARDAAWQQANESRLRENAQRLVDSNETTFFTERWEGYYVAVTREGQRLVLWMMDAEAASTDWIQSVNGPARAAAPAEFIYAGNDSGPALAAFAASKSSLAGSAAAASPPCCTTTCRGQS